MIGMKWLKEQKQIKTMDKKDIKFAFILNMPIMLYFLLNFLALGNFFFNSHIY